MQHEHLQVGTPARLRPPQHLDVTGRTDVARRKDRPTADVFTDADRLPLLVIEHLQVRHHDKFQLSIGRAGVCGRVALASPINLAKLRNSP